MNAFLSLGTAEEVRLQVEEGQITLENAAALGKFLSNTIKKLTLASSAETGLWLLAYSHSWVKWGYYYNGQFDLDFTLAPENLLELRVFGLNGELYLWQAQAGIAKFGWRLRQDTADLIVPAFSFNEKNGYSLPSTGGTNLPNLADEWQVLWGNQVKAGIRTNWTTVWEQRGAALHLPHPLLATTKLPLRLRVRHYLTYDSGTGLCYCQDARLVELRDNKLNSLPMSKTSQFNS